MCESVNECVLADSVDLCALLATLLSCFLFWSPVSVGTAETGCVMYTHAALRPVCADDGLCLAAVAWPPHLQHRHYTGYTSAVTLHTLEHLGTQTYHFFFIIIYLFLNLSAPFFLVGFAWGRVGELV